MTRHHNRALRVLQVQMTVSAIRECDRAMRRTLPALRQGR
jgi:hypothetical protein